MQDFIFQEVYEEHETLPSTNTYAKEQIENGNIQKVFIVSAKTQTNGRGRLNRSWDSSQIGNIYLSIAIHESLLQKHVISILPLYCAFSIIKAINSNLVKYKWPNDLLIENKKFCGILIENFNNFYIIGTGINSVSNPPNALFPSTNLKDYNLTISPKQIYESLQECINLNPESIINFLKNNFFHKENISINKGEFIGKFHDITKNGNLVLTLENGAKKEITFGDIGFV